jgi:hypothetical protein
MEGRDIILLPPRRHAVTLSSSMRQRAPDSCHPAAARFFAGSCLEKRRSPLPQVGFENKRVIPGASSATTTYHSHGRALSSCSTTTTDRVACCTRQRTTPAQQLAWGRRRATRPPRCRDAGNNRCGCGNRGHSTHLPSSLSLYSNPPTPVGAPQLPRSTCGGHLHRAMALLLRGCVAPVGHAAFRRAELLPRRRSSSRLVTVASAAASSAPSSGDGAATAAPPSDAHARSDAAVAGANGAVVAAASRSTLIETTVERVRASSFAVPSPSA